MAKKDRPKQTKIHKKKNPRDNNGSISEIPEHVLTTSIFPFLFSEQDLKKWTYRLFPVPTENYSQKGTLCLVCKSWMKIIKSQRSQVKFLCSADMNDMTFVQCMNVTFDLYNKSKSMSFDVLKGLTQDWYENRGDIECPLFLREIHFSHWYWTKDLPFDITKNPQLTSLSLDDVVCKVKWLDKTLPSLPCLQSLVMVLQGKLFRLRPVRNATIQNLTMSDCENNEAVINETLKNLPNLKSLTLYHTDNSRFTLDDGRCSNLTNLCLVFTNELNPFFLQKILKSLTNLHTLEIVYASELKSQLHISSDSLEHLQISAGCETGNPEPLIDCENLKSLSIRFITINDNWIVKLDIPKMSKLVRLDLISCSLLKSPFIKSSSLSYISFLGCENLDNPTLDCPSLKKLIR
ncbi:proA [Acrasis kona]|uniref:ProA n=1 Tax=Acrasis kona TaxID=1008807 RepID=A0AAW2YHB5_9EUKA